LFGLATKCDKVRHYFPSIAADGQISKNITTNFSFSDTRLEKNQNFPSPALSELDRRQNAT